MQKFEKALKNNILLIIAVLLLNLYAFYWYSRQSNSKPYLWKPFHPVLFKSPPGGDFYDYFLNFKVIQIVTTNFMRVPKQYCFMQNCWRLHSDRSNVTLYNLNNDDQYFVKDNVTYGNYIAHNHAVAFAFEMMATIMQDDELLLLTEDDTEMCTVPKIPDYGLPKALEHCELLSFGPGMMGMLAPQKNLKKFATALYGSKLQPDQTLGRSFVCCKFVYSMFSHINVKTTYHFNVNVGCGKQHDGKICECKESEEEKPECQLLYYKDRWEQVQIHELNQPTHLSFCKHIQKSKEK